MRFPTIAYPGAKGRLAPSIVAALPPTGGTYYEPFAGTGNIFWAAATTLNYQEWWINDIQTAPLFRAIRTIGDTVHIPLRTREEYVRHKSQFLHGSPLSIILQPYLTYAGGGYDRAGFGNKKGATPSGYTKTIRECHRLLNATAANITNLDWKLPLSCLDSNDVVVLDPPYKGADVRAYKSNSVDHEEMVRLLKKAKFRWVLTEYSQDLYLKHLGKPFFKKSVQLACTDFRLNGGQERRVECMWKNF